MNLKECKEGLIYDLHNAVQILFMTSKHTNNQQIKILLHIEKNCSFSNNVMSYEVIHIAVKCICVL